MPARLGRIAAHALGDQAQPGRPPGPCGKLQAPPRGQAEGGGDLQRHHGDGPVAQGLFGDGQRVLLIPGHRHHQPRRIKARKPKRVQHVGLPAFPYPQQIRPRLPRAPQHEGHGAGAGHLVNAAGQKRIGGNNRAGHRDHRVRNGSALHSSPSKDAQRQRSKLQTALPICGRPSPPPPDHHRHSSSPRARGRCRVARRAGQDRRGPGFARPGLPVGAGPKRKGARNLRPNRARRPRATAMVSS